MDKAEDAFLKMGETGDRKSLSGLAKEIVCYGLRKEPDDLKDIDGVDILELFEKVMEKNKDFFTRLRGETTDKIVTIIAPELMEKLKKEQSISPSQDKEFPPQS